jgi:predicted HTH transcriptional regulator
VLPPLPSKPLAELTEADLLRLVEDEVREDVEIDYKARLETDSQEFAKDVSSFANTKGGYLVYGMSEDRELPTGLVALDGFDPSTAIERFNSWAQEHIRPRLLSASSRSH